MSNNLISNITTRIPWVDILRGIAIILMIPANLSIVWSGPHPLWFRIMASYAAPLFLMLSTGMMVLNSKKYRYPYFVERGLIIIGFGALVDICVWKIFPFVTVDILYLIGLSLPLIYLVRHFSHSRLLLIGLIIFILAPVLQNHWGYHANVVEVKLDHLYWPGILRLLQYWLVDGWFPILPWLGFLFFSVVFFRILFKNISKKIIVISYFCSVIGFILLFTPQSMINSIANHGILTERGGFSEIFYPPTSAYFLTVPGVIILFVQIAQYLSHFKISQALSLLGRFSLLIYIFHQVFCVYVITPIIQLFGKDMIQEGVWFLLVSLLTILIMYFICFLIEKLKQGRIVSSIQLQMLIGK